MTPSRFRRLLRAAGRLLTMGALTLLLLEAAVRGLDVGGISYFSEVWRYERTFLKDARLRYRQRPRFSGMVQGVPVRINGRGLRDRERAERKPRDGFRILLLGDSVTFGWGVRFEQTFGQLLERTLNAQRRGFRFEVINSGVNSYGTHQELAYLEEAGFGFQPDLVVLIHCSNDANTLAPRFQPKSPPPPPAAGDPGTRLVRWLLRHSRVAQLLTVRAQSAVPLAEQMKTLERDNPYWLSSREALVEMKRLCQAQQVPFVVFSAAVFGGPLTERQNRRLRELAEATGIATETKWYPNPGLTPRALVNSFFDPHWNPRGHQLAAEGMLRVLDRRRLLPPRPPD